MGFLSLSLVVEHDSGLLCFFILFPNINVAFFVINDQIQQQRVGGGNVWTVAVGLCWFDTLTMTVGKQ